MSDDRKLRVAIIGASGIGKNHAAWFAKNGAEVCAFLGSSDETITTTRGVLQSKLGYTPSGYTDLTQLLKQERPDAACIASPPHLHFEHAKICLETGVHTLCEKPMVYDSQSSNTELISQAWKLKELAEAYGVLLGIQMQYGFLINELCGLAGVAPEEIETFSMEMETKNLKPGRSHETVWIELASHPLSVLQKIFPDAEIEIDSIECRITEWETTASFRLQRADGSPVNARIVVRCNLTTPTPLRRFKLNDTTIDYAGRRNEASEFLSYLSANSKQIEMPDLVDLLIANFIAACRQQNLLLVTGKDGAKNVEWMLRILERSGRA